RVRLVEQELRRDPAGSIQEQPRGVRGPNTRGVGIVRWKAERRDGPRAFALDPQGLPASREDPDVGTLREHVVAELRACIEDVLAVVEQEEEAPIAQRV